MGQQSRWVKGNQEFEPRQAVQREQCIQELGHSKPLVDSQSLASILINREEMG